jgi:IMP cyclohydrolase
MSKEQNINDVYLVLMKDEDGKEGVLSFYASQDRERATTALAMDKEIALNFIPIAEAISQKLGTTYRIAHYKYEGDLYAPSLVIKPAPFTVIKN